MEKQSATAPKREKYLIFNLAGKRYGLSLARVKEVTSFIEPTRLPNVPSYFLGLINLRGQVITVVDMAMKFGVGSMKFLPQRTCIIISSIGQKQFGFLVDEVYDVTSFAPADFSALKDKTGHTIKHRGVNVIAKDEDESLTPLIDLENAFEETDVELFSESVQAAL